MPSQNIPLKHKDYFETARVREALKTIEVDLLQDKFTSIAKMSFVRMSSLCKEEDD